MARPRKHGSKALPANLYAQKRGERSYFSYRNPLTNKSLSLGFDREFAIEFAERSNREIEADLLSRKCAGLIDHEEIVRGAYEYSGVPGIYFLLQDFEIVYIGMSQDVFVRIGQHKIRSEIPFNRVFSIRCDPSDLASLEAKYIIRFKPRFNALVPISKTQQ